MFFVSNLRAAWWAELTHWRTPAGRRYRTAPREATRPAAGSWAEWAALMPACLYCWCAGRQSRPAESAAHCRWNTGQDTQHASQIHWHTQTWYVNMNAARWSRALLHTHLRERTQSFVAVTECEVVVCCVAQVQNAPCGVFRDVPVLCYALNQMIFLTCKLHTDKGIASD